jgi:hypothetical protein
VKKREHEVKGGKFCGGEASGKVEWTPTRQKRSGECLAGDGIRKPELQTITLSGKIKSEK